jgi:SAM-dependent methyltransferase
MSMKELFRRTPLQQFAEYSSSHLHAGSVYQARFHERPGRAGMWALEQPLIRDIFARLAPRRMLDFATGTGRIAAELEATLPNCELHAIDISADMLEQARAKCRRVAFHQMDGRQALAGFGEDAFDAVAAFRFFPNADPALREDVADQIARLTKPGGHVVLNNHRSFWSLSYMAMRAAGNSYGSYGTPNVDIMKLFLRRGFSCVRRYSLGVWPQTDFRAFVLPWSVATAIENFNKRFLARAHTLGYNTVFVFRKDV